MRVVDNATVRRIDERSIASGTPSIDLKEQAGQGAACCFLSHAGPDAGVTLVACGRGNNGGDGLVFARALHLAGHRVAVFWTGGDPTPDCATNLERAREIGVEEHMVDDHLDRPRLQQTHACVGKREYTGKDKRAAPAVQVRQEVRADV